MVLIRRNSGCRINDDIRYKGLRAIAMENEILKLTILVDKGTDIIELLYKPKDIDFMWISPKSLKEGEINRYDFLESYIGGWQEIIPNGGSPCVYKGVSLGLHEETPLLSWDHSIVEDCYREVSIKFYVRLKKIPLYIEKTISLISNSPVIYISESIKNTCSEEIDFMWGHHPCFGDSFLSSDCIINFKSKEIISNSVSISDFPMVKPNASGTLESFPGVNGNYINLSKVLRKEAKVADLLYVTKLLKNWFSITNLKKKVGIGFIFNKDVFKYLYLWLVYGGGNNYPWFSNTYSLAIEPWSSYPGLGLLEAIKNKTSLKISPGKVINSWLKVVVFKRDSKVNNIDDNCIVT
ncbi:MAG: aldose 1-epimerase [Actinobacteria bacterium]|nr:aldose 1-epimerase [Actinomycetota bacterium]